MDAPDVYAEGIRIPPSKWNWDEDWNGGKLEALPTVLEGVLQPGDVLLTLGAGNVGAVPGILVERWGQPE